MASILLATSDADLQSVIEAEITSLGYDVVWATDGLGAYDEALSLAPMLVLLDRHLEIFDGLEVCLRLREDPEVADHLPIFLLTDEDIDPRMLERAGVTSVFPKTHSASEIADLLAQYAALEFVP